MGVECYDVIVVGAGSVGTPAALALAEAGVRTLVLDRFPSVGQGSNKRAIGGVRATHSDPAKSGRRDDTCRCRCTTCDAG